jgi:hypothetical protein
MNYEVKLRIELFRCSVKIVEFGRRKREDNLLWVEILAMNYEVKLRIELSGWAAKIVEFGCACYCCEKQG